MEAQMAIRMAGNNAFLDGDWTLHGTPHKMDSLSSSLQLIESVDSDNYIHIDCGQISRIDTDGLQLLNVWLECVRIRGAKPRLVNVPERLKPWVSHLVLH
jgi:ABC-type transporter Mla MlaB component